MRGWSPIDGPGTSASWRTSWSAPSSSRRATPSTSISTPSFPAAARRRPVGLPPSKTIQRRHNLAVLRQTQWVIDGPRGPPPILGLHPNTLRSRLKKLGITRAVPRTVVAATIFRDAGPSSPREQTLLRRRGPSSQVIHLSRVSDNPIPGATVLAPVVQFPLSVFVVEGGCS